MDMTRSQKHGRDSPPHVHTPTAKPPYKRTRISMDNDVNTTKDDGEDIGNTPAAPARCLLDEEPDAEGFYHCIRLREYRMQPAHGSFHAAVVEVHSLSVKPSVLSPSLGEALDQSQPSLVSIENNQGSFNVQKSSIEETNISGHSCESETSSLIINPIAGAAKEDEKLNSPNFGDFRGNTIYVHHDQGQDQGGEHSSFGEETDTEDWISGPQSEGSNFSTDNDCHMDDGPPNNDNNELPYTVAEQATARTLGRALPILSQTRTLRSGRGKTFFELLPGCSASLKGVMAKAKPVAEAPYWPGASQEVLQSEAIPPVATAPAMAISASDAINTPRWCHSVSFPENDEFENGQGKGNEGKDKNERKNGNDNEDSQGSTGAALTSENLFALGAVITPIEFIETCWQGYHHTDHLLPLHCTSVDGTWANVE